MGRPSVLVLGDQLDPAHPLLAQERAAHVRVLMIESEALLRSRPYHRQRLWLVLTAMRRYAAGLREQGFQVDYLRARSFRAGIAEHRKRARPSQLSALEPTSHGMRALLRGAGLELHPHARFLCSEQEFRVWAERQRGLRMDEFYRRQRRATGYLMDGDRPLGGAFSYDMQNREPPPRAEVAWPEPPRQALDALDTEVLHSLPDTAFGAPPDGTWATTRSGALARLTHFVDHVLPRFGPHQDAMLRGSWHLAHSLLSPYLNLGLLHPREVCEAALRAFERRKIPLSSIEGYVRQVIGWREYVWGTYWLFGPEYRHVNALAAHRKLLPLYTHPEQTRMRCVKSAVESVRDHAYAHHIERLMILGNLALLAGVVPHALADWMQASFIDGGEWVMWPNVLGMALYADGGRLSTKPYAAGGAYIHRMSDFCKDCGYEPKQRTGPDACPYTTLYWDFLARHEQRLAKNPRMGRAILGLSRLSDLPAVRARAQEVLEGLSRGTV